MARVTVEDCIEVVNSRFELVILAAKRARDIASGAALTIFRDNDKNPVVALREIAGKTVGSQEIEENIIRSMQRQSLFDDGDADLELELSEAMQSQSWEDAISDHLQQVEAESRLAEMGEEDDSDEDFDDADIDEEDDE